jgi:hypothetical protein
VNDKTKNILDAAQKAYAATSVMVLRQLADIMGEERFDGNKIDGIVLGVCGAAIELYHDLTMQVFGKSIGDEMAIDLLQKVGKMGELLKTRQPKSAHTPEHEEAEDAFRIAEHNHEAMEAIARVKLSAPSTVTFTAFVKVCENTKLTGEKLGYAFKRVCEGDVQKLVQMLGTQALADEVNNYGPFALKEKVQVAA